MKQFILTKYNDPRCIEYYLKAFPDRKKEELEIFKLNWIKKNIK